jgi:hypothetical protein
MNTNAFISIEKISQLIVDEGQFDKKILPRKIQELTKEFNIKYDPVYGYRMEMDACPRLSWPYSRRPRGMGCWMSRRQPRLSLLA